MQGISSVASRNNPIKYTDPDGRECGIENYLYDNTTIGPGFRNPPSKMWKAFDDSVTRFAWRNFGFFLPQTPDTLISTMDGRIITLSESGVAFSNKEKSLSVIIFTTCCFLAVYKLSAISNFVHSPALKWNGNGWTSKEGLNYGMGSKEGNRVLHVLEHTKSNPNKPVHTVFNVKKNEVIGLIDEAWAKRGCGVLQGNKVVYDINMGKIVGTTGETSIRIVTDGFTNNLITAYPIQ